MTKKERVLKNDFAEKKCMACGVALDRESQKELKCEECE